MLRNNWTKPKVDDTQVRFLSRPKHYRPKFHYPTNFEKSWNYAKYVYACCVDLDKACDRVLPEKLWEALLEYGVDGRLLLGVKSLYSCQGPDNGGEGAMPLDGSYGEKEE